MISRISSEQTLATQVVHKTSTCQCGAKQGATCVFTIRISATNSLAALRIAVKLLLASNAFVSSYSGVGWLAVCIRIARKTSLQRVRKSSYNLDNASALILVKFKLFLSAFFFVLMYRMVALSYTSTASTKATIPPGSFNAKSKDVSIPDITLTRISSPNSQTFVTC